MTKPKLVYCHVCGDTLEKHKHDRNEPYWCQWGKHYVGRKPKYKKDGWTQCLGCFIASVTFHLGP